MINWHRLFGIVLTDFFAGSPFTVELEKDVSIKRQLLDVVIVRRTQADWDQRLPDGLDDLADHNLISYKSLHEPFDDWTLKELTGYYVNYRKQVTPARDELLSEDNFRLYGVCTRFPQKPTGQVQLDKLSDGVYEIKRGTDRIRLIVLSEIGDGEHNRLWWLFSGVPEHVRTAAREYDRWTGDASTVLNQLFAHYQAEGLTMPYTREDFIRDCRKEVFEEMTTREVLEYVSVEELLKDLPAEERLRGLPAEEVVKALPSEEVAKALPTEERLKGLSREVIQEYLERLSKLEARSE